MTGDLACVLWAQHKPRDAAQLIGSLHLGEADEREIHSISHAFERAFANKPVAEVEAAFKELGAVKLSYNQLEDIIDVQRAGHAYETAFALGQLMPFPDGQIQLDVESYASLKLARGPDAALAWLRPRWHGRTLVVAAKVVYFRGRDELLWSLYDADEPEGGEETWMYRALAYLRERKPEAAQQKLLEKHYASPGKTFAERAIATAVRGDDGQALLAKVHDESELALAAYALGIRAEHYRRAMRMFQLAVTTSPAAGNPQNLASEELRGLAGSYSLELLATGFWPVADAQ